jgi:hypothetical protein
MHMRLDAGLRKGGNWQKLGMKLGCAVIVKGNNDVGMETITKLWLQKEASKDVESRAGLHGGGGGGGMQGKREKE